jgi:hypothetical protein
MKLKRFHLTASGALPPKPNIKGFFYHFDPMGLLYARRRGDGVMEFLTEDGDFVEFLTEDGDFVTIVDWESYGSDPSPKRTQPVRRDVDA